MRTYRFVQVDVFAEGPFMGNPLAVFPQAAGLGGEEMQAIAREMNLSETTFVTPAEGEGHVRVRIFTPEEELPFAGHPSVGTACELVRLGVVRAVEPVTHVVLELGVGPRTVDVEVRGALPVAGTVHQGAPIFGAPVQAGAAAGVLGLSEDDIDGELGAQVVGTGLDYVIIPLRRQDALASIVLDLARMTTFEREYGEVYPFAFTGRDDPWAEARGLFPLTGIPEDPATGSAAGPLAAYLAQRGLLKPGERRTLLQGMRIGRPSKMTLQVVGSAQDMTDVLVGGGVVPMLSGELTLAG